MSQRPKPHQLGTLLLCCIKDFPCMERASGKIVYRRCVHLTGYAIPPQKNK